MGATSTGNASLDGEPPPDGDERRRRRLLSLVAAAGPPDHGVAADGLRGRLERLCGVAVAEVGVSGAGITVMSGIEAGRAGHRDQVCASGALTARLEDLQLTTGEGPCLDAYEGGAPVLAGDLAADATRWLGFGPEALAAGAAAVFSLPLQLGAVRLGTLDLYRDTGGALGRDQFADALVLAGLATETLLELVGDREPAPDRPGGGRPGDVDGAGADGTAGLLSETMGWLPDVHAEVHQASGMVSVQQGVGVGEALLRIRAHAFSRSIPIDRVARRILDRDLVLGEDQDGNGDTTDEGPSAPGTGRNP